MCVPAWGPDDIRQRLRRELRVQRVIQQDTGKAFSAIFAIARPSAVHFRRRHTPRYRHHHSPLSVPFTNPPPLYRTERKQQQQQQQQKHERQKMEIPLQPTFHPLTDECAYFLFLSPLLCNFKKCAVPSRSGVPCFLFSHRLLYSAIGMRE